MKQTRWHKCVDLLRDLSTASEVSDKEHMNYVTQKFSHLFFENHQLDTAPVFMLFPKNEGDGYFNYTEMSDNESYIMLYENTDVLPWPFDRFIIEFWHSMGSSFLCVERQGDKHFEFICLQSAADAVILQAIGNGPSDAMLSETRWSTNGAWKTMMDVVGGSVHDEITTSLFGFRTLMVQLTTKGMVQERTEAPAALNKQRMRKGKTPVPTVIHMRPGHYYDRDGNQHAVDARNPVRMHWRRGHTRGTWCGTGDSRRLEQRYIAPCLVNYDGGEQPEHKVRILH